jgi:hypothetical protein
VVAFCACDVVDVFDITLLDVTTIRQHGGTQITGGAGTNDVARKATLDEVGYCATMVDVSMRKNENVYLGGIKGKCWFCS